MADGEVLRDRRRRLGITQEELAERTRLSVRSIRDIEANRVREPRSATVRLLADALGEPDPPVPAQLPPSVPAFTGRADAITQLDMLLAAGNATERRDSRHRRDRQDDAGGVVERQSDVSGEPGQRHTGPMRLSLSSFRIGAHPDRLVALADGGRRTALIPNALDGLPTDVRDTGLRRDLDDLDAAGLDVTLIDLREPAAVANLVTYDIVWVRGGNVFVLRQVLANTGTDIVLLDLLHRDAVVYGGYSAGACVLAPDLTGLALVDDPAAVAEPIMTGLGLLDRPFVPHVRSPGHPETTACDAVAAAYAAAGQPHWALRDGEVLLVNGGQTQLLPA